MVERASFEKFIGATLGNYRLEQLQEQNKWGPVFIARTNTSSTPYLIRFLIIPTDLASEARIVYLGRFQQEANRIASLQNPHIIPLLDYGNYQGMPYLVYPQNSLPSLRSQLSQKTPQDVITIGRYLSQIVEALEYAHEHAILHRNLSTACIFMQQDRKLKIADFGFLGLLELGVSNANGAPAQSQRIGGSSESIAPEQLLGKPVDTYTDTYALGAILYRLLTGHPVFTGSTREAIEQQHLSAAVPPLKTWRGDLPAGLDQVIERAMAKEPAQRFLRANELLSAYYQVVDPKAATRLSQASQPVSAAQVAQRPPAARQAMSPPVGTHSARRQQISRRRMITLVATGGGIAALAIVGSGYYFLSQNHNPSITSSTNPAGATNPTGSSPGNKGAVIARTSDVPVNSAKTFKLSGSNSNNPDILVHLSNNHFVAFDSTCTHAGCAVDYNPQSKLLECPCHQAAFDPARNAAVVQGPATTPLAPVKIVVNADGTITA